MVDYSAGARVVAFRANVERTETRSWRQRARREEDTVLTSIALHTTKRVHFAYFFSLCALRSTRQKETAGANDTRTQHSAFTSIGKEGETWLCISP